MHSTFDTPDRLLRQIIELPDGGRYLISPSRRCCAARRHRDGRELHSA
jgi:predicted transcriptional regulator